MRKEIRSSFLKHVKGREIFTAIIVMFLLSFCANLASDSVQKMYEDRSPVSRWFEYESIVPDYYGEDQHFQKWETLRFDSKVIRKKSIYMARQDRAYCKQNWSTVKYPMQLRPEQGFEYMDNGKKNTSWKYYVPIEEKATSCRMCGTSIGYTPLWYEKHIPYCIDWFEVNK